MLDRFDLSGQTAVITGGSRGIGRAVALGFADAGADVVPTARTEDDVQSVVEAVRDRGSDSLATTVDVTDKTSVQELFRHVDQELGGVDVLINNAGVNPDEAIGAPREVDVDTFEFSVDVNLQGVYRCASAASEYLHENGGGCVVNVASVEGMVGLEKQHPYVASKHGVVGLTKSLALEWAPTVRVNAVAPGYVGTDLTAGLQEIDPLHEEMIDRIPLDRMASPKEMVGPTLFLASDAAGYVTGTCLPVDGGWSAQ